MGLSSTLRRWAFARPNAFPVLGRGGSERWSALLARDACLPVRRPHDADLLVLAGEVPDAWTNRLCRLFETFALPRAAIWLAPDWRCAPPRLPLAATIRDAGFRDAAAALSALLDPRQPANRRLLEDRPPHPWRGEGEHGQGGEGMMGGRPYGRPMAMTADDVDDLALDDVPTRLGPHFPGLPSGLEIELRMQGDRVHGIDAVKNHFPALPAAEWQQKLGDHTRPAARAAGGQAVTLAEIEGARLASHLDWLADFLDLAGMETLAAQARRTGRQDDAAVRRLLSRAGGLPLRRVCSGVGRIPVAEARALSGPNARASGHAIDARCAANGYPAFEPIVEPGGDVSARVSVRLREMLRSLELIAGDATTTAAEGPRGSFAAGERELAAPSAAAIRVLDRHLPGMTWSEAVLFVASLDIDAAEAALA